MASLARRIERLRERFLPGYIRVWEVNLYPGGKSDNRVISADQFRSLFRREPPSSLGFEVNLIGVDRSAHGGEASKHGP